MSIRNRVLIGFVTCIILPLIALGIAGSAMFQTVLQKKYSEQSQLINASVARNVATIFKDATAYSDQSMFSSRVQEFLNRTAEERDMTEMPSLLNQTFLMYGPLDTVTLYTLDGEAFSRSKTDMKAISMDKLEQSGMLSEMVRRNGISVWLGPYEGSPLIQTQRYFTQMRVVNDLNRQETIGYVTLHYQFNELEQVFNFYSSKLDIPNHFMLVNHDGRIVYDNQKEESGENLFDKVSQPLSLDRDSSSTKLNFNGVKSILSVQPLNMKDLGITNLTLVSVVPWEYLTRETMTIFRLISIIMAIILLFALLFNMMFIKRYIRFIVRMMHAMKLIELGDLGVRVTLDSRDETGSLARSFNRLVEKVEELIEEVKQEQARKNRAELMLLQAQIKPHFIMNTLESINALNMRNERDKVSQMVYRLGENLHISFQEQEEITLGKEIGYLKNYFEIQKVRFGHLFDYEIIMPPELERYMILKFTLQPLVENSIQHGFDDIDRKGMVSVRIEEKEHYLLLWVEDNGSGIDPDVLPSFHYRKTKFREEKRPDDGRVGLGVMNVADRLRMHYGIGYGMFICSDPGHGTKIVCLIPKREVDSRDDSRIDC
ncbi:sensor histidine kinase [Paenibacillaceae bacterium]|nr:sensor histidine kinase [Paenibacillaceae bacterium]